MSQRITSSDFEKYLNLINGLYADACELILLDEQYLPILTSTDFDKSEFVSIFVTTEITSAGGIDVDEKVNVHQLSGNRVFYSLNMIAENDLSMGVLGLIVNQGLLPKTICSNQGFSSLLENISVFIKNERMLNIELDAMANELGERYDELNLVYDTDSHTQEVHNTLMQIVENCVTYMGVSMAILSLPDKNILISHGDNSRKLSDSSVVIEKAKDILYHKVKEVKASIILNEQVAVNEICSDLSCKILTSPIFSGDGHLDGVIITAKNQPLPDYNNSDRNLLEVMAKKIMQVIQSNYDTLTGLLNRTVFERYIDKSLSLARKVGSTHAFLHLDIDDLQVINENFSYKVGDDLIKSISKLIREKVRDRDIVSRIGGDEFGVILESCSLESGLKISNNILDGIRHLAYKWDNKQLEISATIGLTSIDASKESSASILSESEVARDTAKELGKNRVHVFQRDDAELLKRKDEMQWVTRIKTALREDQFLLYAQPIVPLQDNSAAHHFEILLRLRGEDGSILTPWSFIPAAERYHLMPEIDRWVVSKALSTLTEQFNKLTDQQTKVAINLSGQSIGNKEFLEFLLDKLALVKFPLENICFEVTESAAVSKLSDAQNFMSIIKEKGCKFSLDDFGTGLSSFAYLKTLPVDYLKIDGSFVKEILNDPVSDAMVSAINQVGHVMGLETIAEFVENDAIREHLVKLGVSFGQGYGIGMPRPILEQLEDMSR